MHVTPALSCLRALRPRVLGVAVALVAAVSGALSLPSCSTPPPPPEPEVVPDPFDTVTPTAGEALRITRDTRVAPGQYVVPATEEGALVLEGLSGVTLDLNGADLRGAAAGTDLDRCVGHGIVVRGCSDVTIRNGTLGGYKVCVLVEDSVRVTLEDLACAGWFGMRLRSTSAAEDGSDWLYPHENDAGQWNANYGAALSIVGGEGHVVRRCRGRKGQNGILLNRVERANVYDNDFSFLSGWGLGMYRASENVVAHNWFDYCVRGYSHDVYWRGQDSAGILMFERCSRNLVAYNSATHGGDGVFLYAGQDLVEGRAVARGEGDPGGSDGNVFLGNDLRYAVANAFEATFSLENVLIENDLSGCHMHGVWGGYSTQLLMLRNRIDGTRGGGVTIEHGQECYIVANELSDNEMGVELYWDEDPGLVGGPLGRQRDTSSRDHWIVGNTFRDNVLDLRLSQSTGIVIHDNNWLPGNREAYIEGLAAADDPTRGEATVRAWFFDLEGRAPSGNVKDVTLSPWTGELPDMVRAWSAWTPPSVEGTLTPRGEDRGLVVGGLESIVMGEFGPWDHRAGEPRPKQRKPGGLVADATWRARWFRWDPAVSDPRTNEPAWRAASTEPLVEAEVPTFVNPFGGSERVKRAVGNDHFGLLASTSVELAEGGAHEFIVVSDDGVRLLVDGEVVFEDWSHHAPKRDVVPVTLEAGPHFVQVEYFQIQGALALLLELERAH
ncbi:MAG: right-handed parallel beta-helix repeat-containing protein [Planctomycetota bacterium]